MKASGLMKKLAAVISGTALIAANAFALPVCASETNSGGYWELYDTEVEEAGLTEWTDGQNVNGWGEHSGDLCYKYSINRELGRTTYKVDCINDNYSASGWPMFLKGDNAEVTCSTEAPPDIIRGGEKLALSATLKGDYQDGKKDPGGLEYSIAENGSLSVCCSYSGTHGGYRFFDFDGGDGTTGVGWQTLYTSKEEPSFSVTMTCVIDEGESEEDILDINPRVGTSSTSSTYHYYYKWHPEDTTPEGGMTESGDEDTESGDIHVIIDTSAADEEGEDSGVTIDEEIVEGRRRKHRRDDDSKAGAVGGAAAVAAAAAAAAAGKKGKKKGGSSYKMHVYKEFGDTLEPGKKYFVYARIVEYSPAGKAKPRDDLSQKINISGDESIYTTPAHFSSPWAAAQIELIAEKMKTDAVVEFEFVGKGGTFTQRMHFKIEAPRIVFSQEHIAFPALMENEAKVEFKVCGFDLKSCTVEALLPEGSSYAVQAIRSSNIEDTYFAVFVDINTAKGEAGTYDTYPLTVRAQDSLGHTAETVINVYRVSLGLNISAPALNCYRILKPEASGKAVDALTMSDFNISYTEATAMIVTVDEEKHLIMQLPAVLTKEDIEITPLPDLSEDARDIDRRRIEAIGFNCITTELNKGSSKIYFLCENGWLEPPIRIHVMLKASVTFMGKKYDCERKVLLRSQKPRVFPTYADTVNYTNIDKQQRDELDDIIARIDEYDLIDLLPGEHTMIKNMIAGYDLTYGYDELLVAQIKYNIQRLERQLTQQYLEELQATANSNASFWNVLSRSFANVQAENLTGWKAFVARIGLGIVTSGASEAVFLSLDVNSARRAQILLSDMQ